MANYTHLSGLNVQGAVETSIQGKLIGSVVDMPEASSQNEGLTILYMGPTGVYIQGKYYVSDGRNWSLSAANPTTMTVDSELSSTSTNPVQNKVIKAELDAKIPASGAYDADSSTITFNAASGAQLFQVTGIESGGEQYSLEVDYTGASDLSGIIVTATPISGATATVQGITNSEGKAFLTVVQNATYRITSYKSSYAFSSTPEVSCTDLITTTSISCYVPGIITITVTDEKISVVGRTITATANGQATRTKTIASGQTSVTFSLPAGTWTFKSDYPSGAVDSTSITQVVEDNGVYSGTISILYKIVYGVRIEVNNSSSRIRVSYPSTIFGQTNAAAGFTSAIGMSTLGGWEGCPLISGIKRQTVSSSLKNPSESDFTDVTDKRSFVSGSSTTDVFTYFPTWWVKMTNDGTNIDYAFSSEQIDSTWKDYAGSVGSNRVGHFRLGCYCSPVTSAVKSYAGVKSKGISLSNAITYTQTDRGAGFDLMTWYQWTYIIMLMIAIYKTTDLQNALGDGVTNGSQSSQSPMKFANDYGMYGSPGSGSGGTEVVFFWLHNIYGDYWQWVGGAHVDSSYRLETNTGYSSTSSFDKTALFTPVSRGGSNGYVKTVSGTTDTGFFPSEVTGSSSTYFADFAHILSSSFLTVGGGYNEGSKCGPFYVYPMSASFEYAVRLSYRL